MTTLTVEQVRNMNLPQLHAEIATRWQKASDIEKKYPAGVTPEHGEDFTQQKEYLTDIDLMETRTQEIEDANARSQRIKSGAANSRRPVENHAQPEGDGPTRGAVKMFGQQFIDSPEYKALTDSGILNNPHARPEMGVKLDGSLLEFMSRKALAYSASGVGGPLIQNDRIPGLDFLWRETTLLDLIPTARTSSNMIEYYELTTSTNNAAFVAEATATTGTTGTKPEGAVGWTLRNSPVSTIAEWIPVTNQFLSDAPAVEGVIRNQLLLHLQLALETGLINGDGNAPNLRGILQTSGIQTLGLAAGASAGGTASIIDAAYAAMNQVMVTGLSNPNAFVMHPNDWQAVRLSRENAATGTLGGYQFGPPSVAGPFTLWGRPVVLALGMVENTLLVGDFSRGCMFFDREQSAIRVGTINDQFVRNMQTLLAEMRGAFAVFRAAAFARVTGV